MGTRDFPWGKCGRCVWLTSYHPCSAERQENPGPSSTRNPLGHLGLWRDDIYLHHVGPASYSCPRGFPRTFKVTSLNPDHYTKYRYITNYIHSIKIQKISWKRNHYGLFFKLRRGVYRVSQEECARFWENVPYVKLHRYNPKHLYSKLNGYGDDGERSLKVWQLLHTYWLPNTH